MSEVVWSGKAKRLELVNTLSFELFISIFSISGYFQTCAKPINVFETEARCETHQPSGNFEVSLNIWPKPRHSLQNYVEDPPSMVLTCFLLTVMHLFQKPELLRWSKPVKDWSLLIGTPGLGKMTSDQVWDIFPWKNGIWNFRAICFYGVCKKTRMDF